MHHGRHPDVATILPADVSTFELARIFRSPRCYAPQSVMSILADIIREPDLALLIDVDSLERSALARVDRVMQLALAALSTTRTTVFLAARYERDRASALQRLIPGARFLVRAAPLAIPQIHAGFDGPLLALSDDPPVFELLAPGDRGLALGRPELARANIVAIADSSVRATLWWLHEERARALAS